jgi:hypothetical protein
MTWDFFWTILGIALLVLGGWVLVYLLKDRQASDRGYDGSDSGGGGGGGESDV